VALRRGAQLCAALPISQPIGRASAQPGRTLTRPFEPSRPSEGHADENAARVCPPPRSPRLLLAWLSLAPVKDVEIVRGSRSLAFLAPSDPRRAWYKRERILHVNAARTPQAQSAVTMPFCFFNSTS
jgi:hypothetical protein